MMDNFRLVVAVLMIAGTLYGQTKAETIEFITRELKTCRNEQFEIKEVEFSDGGNLCKLKISTPGQFSERSLELMLSEIDIYSITKIIYFKNDVGNEESLYVYGLIASTRNNNGGIKKDLSTQAGSEIIVNNIRNGQKIKALEAAFTHLAEITSGRQRSFKIPPSRQ